MNLPVIQPAPNGCTASCCFGFVIPAFSYEELGRAYHAWVHQTIHDGVIGNFQLDNGEWDGKSLIDIEILFPKLIRLGVKKFSPEDGRNFEERNGRISRMVYTCKALDRELGRCRIYDKRPDTCRNHGTKHECGYHGCGLKPEQETA